MRNTTPFISSVARHEVRWLRRLCYAQSVMLVALLIAIVVLATN